MISLVYPMLILIFFTLALTFAIAYSRFKEVGNSRIPANYYTVFRGDYEPDYLVKISRHFSNLLEVPLLFYAVTILYLVLEIDSSVALVLAWLFVAFRLMHALVHIGPNDLKIRGALFGLGVVCLLLYMANLIKFL